MFCEAPVHLIKYVCRSYSDLTYAGVGGDSETLPETIESGPLCITDLFQNKSVAYL